MSKINSIDKYKNDLAQWEIKLKFFYEVGKNTFLTKDHDHPGDDETFYLHVLRFYLPQIAKKTLDEHQCGLGIFTMQGFEHRNKQSKNIKKRFTNSKGNVLASILRRLWDRFHHNIND